MPYKGIDGSDFALIRRNRFTGKLEFFLYGTTRYANVSSIRKLTWGSRDDHMLRWESFTAEKRLVTFKHVANKSESDILMRLLWTYQIVDLNFHTVVAYLKSN